MIDRHILAAGLLTTSIWGCADPGAAARIESRQNNAVTTLKAARDTYCTLSPSTRARLRRAGKLDPASDICAESEKAGDDEAAQ